MATAIKFNPEVAVTSLSAPTRGNNNRVMTATWKVPKAMTKESSNMRATGLKIEWSLGISGTDPKKVATTSNASLTTSSVNLNSFKVGSKTYTRESFYPVTNKRLSYVTVRVMGTNSKGDGRPAAATRQFARPRKPSISNFTFNAETGATGCTITTDAGVDYQERYDTRYKVTVYNSRTGAVTTLKNTASQATSIPVSYDPSDYQSLTYGQFIRICVEAYARGYVGDSDTVVKDFFISYPAQAAIKGVNVSSSDSTGKCTVTIDTRSTTEHPVDRVRLEYLADTTYSEADQIPAGEGFTSSDIVDNAKCTALSVPVADLKPDPGRYTWIRIRSWHLSETVLFRFSDYVRLKALETPSATAAGDDIVILSAEAGADGKTAVVLLAWNEDGSDDSTGTELTWSDAEDTWRSTEAPEEYSFIWSDGPITGTDPVTGVTKTYRDSAEIVIKNLNEATKYYIRARRYLEGETITYSDYSNTVTVITSETPETIVASSDRYVPTGSPMQVYWTFSGNGLQTEWQIIKHDGSTVIANGQGSIGSAQIDADRLADFAENGTLVFYVQARAGSEWVQSEMHTVTIIDAPELQLAAASSLTAQPISFSAEVSKLSDLTIIITSQGASGQFPEGLRRQIEGDTIYSSVISPEWTAAQGRWSAAITLPSGLEFWDLGHYTMTVFATDRMTGLTSDSIEVEFSIDWTEKAQDPFDAVTLTPVDVVQDGKHLQAVEIALTAPSGSGSGDVYDIYRVCGDSTQLIGQSFPLSYVATDEYAPFGEGIDLSYRIALRTPDGDVEFADIPYTQGGSAMRFDWSGGSLELPYNISIGDSYKKDVDIRKHLDGAVDGYWNSGTERTGSLSSDLILLDQQEQIALARQLARYTGPVFVRTPDGSAYEADVQVTDLSTEGKLTAIAIDATEISLTEEFMLPTPYALED